VTPGDVGVLTHLWVTYPTKVDNGTIIRLPFPSIPHLIFIQDITLMEKQRLQLSLLPHWPAELVSMTIMVLGVLNGSEREPMILAGIITSEFLSKRASLLPSNTNMPNSKSSSLLSEVPSMSPSLSVSLILV